MVSGWWGKGAPSTIKSVYPHYQTRKILSLCTSRGAVHDFELFKRNLNQIPTGTKKIREQMLP